MSEEKKKFEEMDWQSQCKDMKERMFTLYTRRQFCDCSFLVGPESPEIIKAHKIILVAGSPVFEAMFFGSFTEVDDSIKILDIAPNIFSDMLKYMYSEHLNIESIQYCYELYYAAEKYTIAGLVKICSEYLSNAVTADTCLMLHDYAEQFNAKNIMASCKKVFSASTTTIIKSEGFLHASPSAIHTLYSQDFLNISEVDLFSSLDKYVTHRGWDLSSEGDNRLEKDVKLVNEALRFIRFLTMTPKQFAHVTCNSSLLKPEIKLAILLKICDPESELQLPEGFSTSKIIRLPTSPINQNQFTLHKSFYGGLPNQGWR